MEDVNITSVEQKCFQAF